MEEIRDQNQQPKKQYFDVSRRSGPQGCLLPALAGIGAITVAAFVMLALMILAALFATPREVVVKGSTIAVVHINGEIGFSTGVDSEKIVRLLKKAEEDSSVKAIVLRIDSPGGAAAASQEIAQTVRQLKKPVVASVGNSAASGAYWIASACDRVVCNAASSVGSIGVIIAIPNFAGLFEKLGIKYVVIYKGKYKDLGNPARELTPEERQLLEKHAEIIYRQFIREVAKNRKMPEAKVEQLATGEVFAGEEALKIGLIDRIGGFYEAVDEAKSLAGIKGKAQIVDYDSVLPYYLRFLEKYFSGSSFLLSPSGSDEKIPVAR